MIHLAYFSYVYVCCYVMQINYCYCYMPDTDKSVSALATNGHVLDKSKTNPLKNRADLLLLN